VRGPIRTIDLPLFRSMCRFEAQHVGARHTSAQGGVSSSIRQRLSRLMSALDVKRSPESLVPKYPRHVQPVAGYAASRQAADSGGRESAGPVSNESDSSVR
jgi:hypothetical protein